jgi:predicted AAA+ superfamily ATPase
VETIERILDMQLPSGQSAFLWGPRKTGKTTFLRQRFPGAIFFDLLKTDVALDYIRQPSLLRERLAARPVEERMQPIVIDEVQKVPLLLDEIHWLIENQGLQFILCGSSARKLKRGRANLLGGRAWRFEMFPLVTAEMANFDLLQALNRGLIPSHYQSAHYRKSLGAYLQDYLKEEVFAEGLTRNIPAFARFFEAIGYSHGELTNYANIARDCGVDAKTVKEYYQILCDTLLGRLVLPYKKRQERQVITKAPKFYLFDVGVAGAITKRRIPEAKGEIFGKAFEHFIFLELVAHSSYMGLNYNIWFWRTKNGIEVDFILGDAEIAIEVKGKRRLDRHDLAPLRTFVSSHVPRQAILVCNESEPRVADGIRILPWKIFLTELWQGKIIF